MESVQERMHPTVPHFTPSSGNWRGCATYTQYVKPQQTLPLYFQSFQRKESRVLSR